MRSFKKILKWTFIVVGGLVAILLIVNAFLVWNTDARLDRRLAEIKAAGEPVSLADLRHKPIPPERDAVTYLRRAWDDLLGIRDEINTAAKASGDDWECPAVRDATRSAVAAYPDVIPLLEKAANCPEYSATEDLHVFDMNDPRAAMEALLSRTQENREVARLLGSYWPAALLAEDKRDEAARSAITTLKLTRHFDHEPCLVSMLVAIACRGIALSSLNDALQSGPVSNEVRHELERELAKHDLKGAFHQNLLTERVYGLESFRNFPGESNWFARALFNRWKLNYLDIMAWHLANTQAGVSPGARPEASNPVCSLLEPSIEATYTAIARTQSMVNAVRVLNALQQRDDPDALPAADLSDLGLPKEATLDLFTDKPLIVKKVPSGWLIYSVGQDLQDDGGQIGDDDNEMLDYGIAPTTK